MASSIVLQPKKGPDFTQSHTVSSVLLERVEQLVKSYENGHISSLDVSAQADFLIEELFYLQDEDLPLAREGLCRLLKLNVENVQLELIRHLQLLFPLSFLSYDVRNNQLKRLLNLEKQISGILALHIRSTSSEVLLGLIDLYQDILERLWLLPHLMGDRGYVIIEESGKRVVRDAEQWLTPLLSDPTQPDKLKIAFKSLPRMFQLIMSCPSTIINEIIQLKSELNSIYISSRVGDICCNVGNNHRAIGHYFENLRLIDFKKERVLDPKQKMSLEKATCNVLNKIGNGYQSFGNYCEAFGFYEKAMQIVQELGDRRGEGRAYGSLGNVYHSLGEYRKAIEHHEKCLQITQEVGDREGEGKAYGNLGNAYLALGNYPKVIEHYKKQLQITQELRDRNGEGGVCGNLGVAHHSLGEYRTALKYHEKHLQLSLALGDRWGEGKAYGNLRNAYFSLGEYRKAIEYHEKALSIAQELGDREGEGGAYGNLGNVYHYLGDYRQAMEHHKKHLQIAQVLGDRGGEGRAHGNLGIEYFFLRDYPKAIENHMKRLQIAQEQGDPKGVATTYVNLGNICRSLGDYRKAIEFYEKSLQITQALGDRGGEGIVYGNLGNAYQSLGEYPKAIVFYKKYLQMTQALDDRDGQGNALCKLGLTHECLDELPQAEQYFRQSVAIYSSIQHALGDSHQWKITIFEKQAQAYLGLERALLNQRRIREALEVSNARRARALNYALAKRKNLPPEHADAFMNIDTILKFVTITKSTYLVYSFCTLSKEGELQLNVYIITASGEIHCKALPLDILPEELKKGTKILEKFPFGRTKGEPVFVDDVLKEMADSIATKGDEDDVQIPQGLVDRFKNRLKKWYEAIIAPIEEYLPKENGSSVVVIPDNFLLQLPFAAFQDAQGRYLIEKFALSTAPSLSVLTLLDVPSPETPLPACVFSNPATPDQLGTLTKSQEHVPHLSSLLKAPPEAIFMRESATAEAFKKVASKARWIHLSCHGEAGIAHNAHSVFEGRFKFTPDKDHERGYLYAEEIALSPLSADFVFLDSCFSGTGKVQREGSIGPIWSFHAAGASSVIGGLWFVPESELVLKMIDTFYEHLLRSGRKDIAFRQAMLLAIEKQREKPYRWGTFILSGKR